MKVNISQVAIFIEKIFYHMLSAISNTFVVIEYLRLIDIIFIFDPNIRRK